MTCEEVDELAGAYALGALPAETLREIDEHLQSCSKHPGVGELRVVASKLALAAPDTEPPSVLKVRIIEALRGEKAEIAEPPRPGAWELMTGRLSRVTQRFGLVGALAAIAIALLIWNVSLQVGSEGPTIERQFTSAGPATGSVKYISDDQVAVLSVRDLDLLPASQTYQVWAISDGIATGVGFLAEVSEEGRSTVAIQIPLSNGEQVAVTVEPAGGSLQPTTEPILAAEL